MSSASAPRRTTLLRRLALGLLCTLTVLYLLVGAYTATTMTWPKRRFKPEFNPGRHGMTYQEIRLPARGGDADLAAWWIPAASSPAPSADPGRAVVLVHGKDSNRSRFIEHSAPIVIELHSRGLNLLMIDLRGHGQSSTSRMSFGIREQRDVLGAVDWLRARGFAPGRIGVLGQSMGGASILLATAAEPAIAAAVSDCAYADIAPIVGRRFHEVTGLPNWFVPATRIALYLIDGVDLLQAKPLAAVPRIAPRPLLIIHGMADATIPVGHAADLRLAVPSAELWVIDGSGHVQGVSTDTAAYQQHVGDFFQKHLP